MQHAIAIDYDLLWQETYARIPSLLVVSSAEVPYIHTDDFNLKKSAVVVNI